MHLHSRAPFWPINSLICVIKFNVISNLMWHFPTARRKQQIPKKLYSSNETTTRICSQKGRRDETRRHIHCDPGTYVRLVAAKSHKTFLYPYNILVDVLVVLRVAIVAVFDIVIVIVVVVVDDVLGVGVVVTSRAPQRMRRKTQRATQAEKQQERKKFINARATGERERATHKTKKRRKIETKLNVSVQRWEGRRVWCTKHVKSLSISKERNTTEEHKSRATTTTIIAMARQRCQIELTVIQ